MVAHNGRGVVRTVRVERGTDFRGLNFIELTDIPPSNSIGVNRHGNQDEEIYVVIPGHGRVALGEREVEVGPGDVIVNPANGGHGLVNTGQEPLSLVVLDVPV